MPTLVIVSGTRPHPALDQAAIGRVQDDLLQHTGERGTIVMHGAAKGVDAIAARWKGCAGHLAMPAQWDRIGRRAGPCRNQEMVNVAMAMHKCGWDIVALCYPVKSSKGTRDMIARLRWEHGWHAKKRPKPTERWTVIVRELET